MGVRVAVDFGTSSTCVVLAVDDHEPQVVVVDGQPLLPSAVFAGTDGTLFVGQEAERQAAIDPSRYEPHPKRRMDEGQLLLGDVVLGVPEVVRAVLRRAVTEAARLAGGVAVDQLVLTHPADWGPLRAGVLRRSAEGLAREIVLLPEPVAAAVFHAAAYPSTTGRWAGAALAVLDLGGGTVDASVVRREHGAFQVLATRGDPGFGGADIDQVLLEHTGSLVAATDAEAWRELLEGRDLAARRRRRVLRQDVRGAKETLSRHAYTDVPMPPPFPDAHVTRADLERLIAEPLTRAADLMLDTVRDAGLTPERLLGVFLVGGSSRIPLVSRLVHERAGVLPTTLDQPETVVARGALRAVASTATRTAGPGPAAPVGPGRPAVPGTVAGPPGSSRPASGETTVAQGNPPPGRLPVPAVEPVRAISSAAPGRRRWWLGAAVLLAAGTVGAVGFAAGGGPPTPAGGTVAGSAAPADRDRVIAQYDYRFALPAGWTQSGGDAPARSVQIRPEGAPPNTDLVLVRETPLPYDAAADRARAIREIHRYGYDDAAARGTVSGFADDRGFAGRNTVYYREAGHGVVADWYVLLPGRIQLAVACQYTPGGADRVAEACAQVVGSLTAIP